jgi:hypothetical protein
MRCVLQDERFAVYDDFLAPPDQARVWRFVQAQRYQGFHQRGWSSVWRLHDGEPLSSAVVFSARSEHASGSDPSASGGPALHVYPTGTGIDRLIEELSLAADRFEPLVGEQGRAWSLFTSRAFLYRAHTGLGWHTDSTVFTGAFSYYAHQEWNSCWGGELFIASTPPGWATRHVTDSPLDNHGESAQLLELGFGQYVSPKPNRLVVLKAGVPHRITPVLAAAGAHVRCSIAGFFVSRDAPALGPEY